MFYFANFFHKFYLNHMKRIKALLLIVVVTLILSPVLTQAVTIDSSPADPIKSPLIHSGADPELQVFIQPSGARTAGAQWRTRRLPSGDWSPWLDSGHVDTVYMDPEIYMEIEFKEIDGWIKPDNQTVYTGFFRSVVTGTYVQYGSIQVTITPQEAVDDGAQWRRVGTSTWFNSGDTETNVPPGEYYVEFKAITGWAQSPNRWVQSFSGFTTTYTATYVRMATFLQVIINPIQATRAGAKWQIQGQTGTYISNEAVELPPGTYTVDFTSARGWIPPPSQTVVVEAGLNTRIEVYYTTMDIGNIRIIADNYTEYQNAFSASGDVRLAFYQPDTSSESGTYSLDKGYTNAMVSISGTVTGQTEPESYIQFNGTLKVTGTNLFMIGSNVLIAGNHRIDAFNCKIEGFSYDSPLELFGTSVEVKYIEFLTDPFGVALSIKTTLNPEMFGDGSYCDIQRMEITGPKSTDMGFIGDIYYSDFKIGDLMELQGVYGLIDTINKSFELTAEKVVIQDMPTFGGSIRIKENWLEHFSAFGEDINLQIDDIPVYLQDININMDEPKNVPMSLTLGIAFSVFERIENFGSIIEFGGEGTLDLSGYYSLYGYGETLGYDCMHGSIEIWTDIGLSGDLYLTLMYGLAKGEGTLTVIWAYKPYWWSGSFLGTVGFNIPEWLRWATKNKDRVDVAECYIYIDNTGFWSWWKLLKLFTIEFHVPPIWDASDGEAASPTYTLKGLETATVSHLFLDRSHYFSVPKKSPGIIFAVQGQNKTPDVVLTLPDGTTIDPAVNLPEENENFMYRYDETNRTAGFMIRNPMAGQWEVTVTNASETGEAVINFASGNISPNIIPRRIVKLGDSQYKFMAKAYDPDDDAKINFYFSQNNKKFNGVPIGSMIEHDGPIEFNWTPSEDIPFKSGYVYAEIIDSTNAMQRVYFSEKINFGTTPLDKPWMGKCSVKKDTIVFGANFGDTSNMDFIRVYYSDYLKADILTDSFNVPPDTEIKLDDSQIKPGRTYKLGITTIAQDGSESEMSNYRKVKYRTRETNNHPFFKSEPECEAQAGKVYRYKFKAADYDKDGLVYSLVNAPEGMELDASRRVLLWKPEDSAAGYNLVTLQVEDGKGGKDLQEFSIMVSTESVPTQQAEMEVIPTEEGRLLFVKIIDRLAGSDPSVREELNITVFDETKQLNFDMTLLETGADTYEFQGHLNLEAHSTMSVMLYRSSNLGRTAKPILTWENKNGKKRELRTLVIGN